MTQPKIAVTKVGSHTVLALGDCITYQNCEELEAHIRKIIGGNHSAIIFDCKGVSFLDSKALEMLLRIQEAIKEQGRQMKIVGLNAVSRDILIATRLINQFHTYPDMKEAIRETS
jgi:anti-anti-sigma factor